jgi:DNA-binding IclR family transcriptional regulator
MMGPDGTLASGGVDVVDAQRDPAPPGGRGTQALDRAAELVAEVVRADEPLTFGHLQESSGLAKSTTSRMLAALERAGLLERTDDGGGYVAGRLFWLYAARHDPWEEVVRLARPTMQQIGEDTRETVHLSVARGDRVAQVAQVDSQYLLGTRDWTDVDVPAHCSALGKVFYAWGEIPLPEAPTEALTEATLTDPAAFARDARVTRDRGWALTEDELEVGLTGVAVPVHGARGHVVAALGVSGPSPRLLGRLDELGRQLSEHAAQLSALLRGAVREEGVA